MADFNTAVTVLKKKPPKPAAMKSEQLVNKARREGGVIETKKKWRAATNKQESTLRTIEKLDLETEELKHDKVHIDVGRLILQGRQAKGLTQKDLAFKINEKQHVIQDYETGRGVRNNFIIGKIERVLGIRLNGKDRIAASSATSTRKSKK